MALDQAKDDDAPLTSGRRRSSIGGGIGGSLQPDFLLKTKEFSGRNATFVKELAMNAALELYTEGDIILKQGDLADKLYCLKSGDVAIIVGDVQVATLSNGAVFGLAAMFDCAGSTNRRNATVKAIGFCDCRVITRGAFHAALKNYPEEKRHFQSLAEEQARVTQENKALAAKKKNMETLKSARAKLSVMSKLRKSITSDSEQGPSDEDAAPCSCTTPEAVPPPTPAARILTEPGNQFSLEAKRRAKVQKVRAKLHARAAPGAVTSAVQPLLPDEPCLRLGASPAPPPAARRASWSGGALQGRANTQPLPLAQPLHPLSPVARKQSEDLDDSESDSEEDMGNARLPLLEGIESDEELPPPPPAQGTVAEDGGLNFVSPLTKAIQSALQVPSDRKPGRQSLSTDLAGFHTAREKRPGTEQGARQRRASWSSQGNREQPLQMLELEAAVQQYTSRPTHQSDGSSSKKSWHTLPQTLVRPRSREPGSPDGHPGLRDRGGQGLDADGKVHMPAIDGKRGIPATPGLFKVTRGRSGQG